MRKNVSILIADDHAIVRRGLRSLLEAHPGFKICAEAATGAEALARARQFRPDVVVLDLGMPETNGVEVAARLRNAVPPAKILVFTMNESPQLLSELMQVGVTGYMFKSDFDRDVVAAVDALSQGRTFFGSRVAEAIYEIHLKSRTAGSGPPGGHPLTARQKQVVCLLAEGKTNKEVASALGISVKTAETHRLTIMHRLNLDSFSDLVRYAVREGLVPP